MRSENFSQYWIHNNMNWKLFSAKKQVILFILSVAVWQQLVPTVHENIHQICIILGFSCQAAFQQKEEFNVSGTYLSALIRS